jgi:amino acid adenylation domain-containing protein
MTVAPIDLVPVDFDPFERGEVAQVYPPTPAQREIWVACAVDPGASVAYNLSLTLDVRGVLDAAALQAAIGDLVDRHDALRTTFSADGQTATVSADRRSVVDVVDIVAGESAEAALERVLSVERTTAYDLEHGPLFRATLLRIDPQRSVLVIGAHHIVCDGWSLAVLLRELGPLYARRRGRDHGSLPAAPSFAAYASQQPSPATQSDTDYFLSQLQDAPPPMELPTDRPRRPGRSLASANATLKLEASLLAAIKTSAAHEGVTPFVTLFTAWTVLLARLSGQHDLVIGLPIGLQSRLDQAGLVGQCTHLLPIRVRLDLDAPFRTVLSEVRGAVLDACEHPLATAGELIPKLSGKRDPSRHPLLSVLFNLDSQFANARPEIESCDVSFKPNARAAETFEIFFNAHEDEIGQLVLDCQYATALWDGPTIDSWLRGLETLLKSFAQAPESSCRAAPIVSADDLADLIERWNQTEVELERTTVLELIRRSAIRRPDAVALKDGRDCITYGELLSHIHKAAQGLRTCGVEPGHLVGLCVRRSIWMVVLAAAVWGAGAAYVPVDPEQPAERVGHILAGARLVIADDSTDDLVSDVGKDQVLAEDLLRYEHGGSLEASPDALAYVLHTSGSTGRPKGVEVTHESLLNFVTSMLREPGVHEDDVVAAVVTLSFDIAGFELFAPLAAGATIVVADEETTRDGRMLSELMTAEKVTLLQATPSTYRLLRAAGYRPAGLRALVGGEPFPQDLAQWLLENGAVVTNCYGPTETTIWSTLHRVADASSSIPIGKPIANTSVYVLDCAYKPVPKGCYGEIVIGGTGVARGYREAPELTEDKFVRLSLPNGAVERVYRTGDVGRWRHDGLLEVAGRQDDQVKIRGHRIELGEIEAALAGIQGVREAGVAVLRPPQGEPRLAAALVVEKGQMITATDMRRHLRRRLPEAMIPAMSFELPALPKTQNGKLDRRELAKLAPVDRSPSSSVVAPATATERLVADLYRHLLRVPVVGASDNFFDLGGDSIASLEAAVAIEKATRVRLSPRELLLGTVTDVAMAIDSRRSAVMS